MMKTATKPSWNRLYETAVAQEGHFTAVQAAAAGYSPQLLFKYLRNGRVRRVRRGVYRVVHFPAGEHEDLAVLWLWSGQEGVLGLETALALHGLSDALPATIHMIVPRSWRARRLRVPTELDCHYADLLPEEQAWHGSVPVTTPARSLLDCVRVNVAPDLVEQALTEGLDRDLFVRSEVIEAERYLEHFAYPS